MRGGYHASYRAWYDVAEHPHASRVKARFAERAMEVVMEREMTFGELAEWIKRVVTAMGADGGSARFMPGTAELNKTEPGREYGVWIRLRNGTELRQECVSLAEAQEYLSGQVREWLETKEQDHARLGAELAATRALLSA